MTKPPRFFPLDTTTAKTGAETAGTAPPPETAAGMSDLNPGNLTPVYVGTVGQAIPALADLKARIIVPAVAVRPR